MAQKDKQTAPRTRKGTATTNDEQSKAQKERDEAKARADAKAKEQADAKAKREAEKKAETEKKAKEREEARAAKEAEAQRERQAQIDSGALIEETDGDGTVVREFHLVTEPKKETVAQRALEVINRLKESDTPVSGKVLADEFGGGTVQWVAFFGMLRVLGLVRAYRFKTGNRGEGGMAYLWVGERESA